MSIPKTETKDIYGRKITYYVQRIEIECYEMKYRILSSTDYFVDGSKETNNEVSDYYYAEPYSLREKLINAICIYK